MKTEHLVMLFGTLAFAAWLAPSLPVEAEKSATSTVDRTVSSQLEQLPSPAETTLARASDGHFYASVAVDSQDVRMLVDTGASVIALTGRDAEAIGLEWSDDELQPIARSASGADYGKAVRLDHVQLGEFEADNVEAIIVPRGLGISLLGQSFLGQVGKVEIKGSRMVLAGV